MKLNTKSLIAGLGLAISAGLALTGCASDAGAVEAYAPAEIEAVETTEPDYNYNALEEYAETVEIDESVIDLALITEVLPFGQQVFIPNPLPSENAQIVENDDNRIWITVGEYGDLLQAAGWNGNGERIQQQRGRSSAVRLLTEEVLINGSTQQRNITSSVNYQCFHENPQRDARFVSNYREQVMAGRQFSSFDTEGGMGEWQLCFNLNTGEMMVDGSMELAGIWNVANVAHRADSEDAINPHFMNVGNWSNIIREMGGMTNQERFESVHAAQQLQFIHETWTDESRTELAPAVFRVIGRGAAMDVTLIDANGNVIQPAETRDNGTIALFDVDLVENSDITLIRMRVNGLDFFYEFNTNFIADLRPNPETALTPRQWVNDGSSIENLVSNVFNGELAINTRGTWGHTSVEFAQRNPGNDRTALSLAREISLIRDANTFHAPR